MDIKGQLTCVAGGKFKLLNKEEWKKRLLSHEAFIADSVQARTSVLVTGDPESSAAKKARKKNISVLTESEAAKLLGQTSDNYGQRLLSSCWTHPPVEGPKPPEAPVFFASGPPAPESAFTALEQRIGFATPEPVRKFFSQHNGLQLFWCQDFVDGSLLPPQGELLAWSEAMAESGPFFRHVFQHPQTFYGLVNIPSAEVVFLTNWSQIYGNTVHHEPDITTVKLGKRTIAVEDFYGHLFPFDFFSAGDSFAALWADRETETLQVVLGIDHGADWTSAQPVDFAYYMDCLVARKGFERPFGPSSGSWGIPTGVFRS